MSASSKKKLRKEQNAVMMTERQQKEQAEAKSVKRMTVTFCVVMALVVLIFAATQVIGAITRNGVFEKNTIVATVGEHKLNSVIMNYYFYDAVTAEYNEKSNTYGDYTDSYFKQSGLDLSKPLNEQVYDNETGETWADYFMDKAIENAKSDYALYDLAVKDNFKLPEDMQQTIDSTLMNLQFYAAFAGASDVDMYLRMMYGNGSTEDSYKKYSEISATAAAYYNAHMEALEYDDAALRAHEKDRYNEYSAYTFNSYYLNYTSFLEGGTEDDKGNKTYSDEEKDAARKAAEAAALSLGSATTVEELDAAIAALEINKDAKEAPKSTLNENVMHNTLREEYAEWMSSADITEGTAKIFPNTTSTKNEDGTTTEVINGYYVLMYKSTNHNLEKLDNVRHILFQFEGGTKDDNGNTTYSAEEKAAAKAEADALLKKWQDGDATEESFIALVHDNTDDSGSKESGGLYEEIHRDSNYVPNFKSWAIDSARKPNDAAVIESDYGYHVMYYIGEDELTYRDYMIRNELINNEMESWYEGVLKAVTVVEGDSSRINKDLIYSPAN